MFVLSTFSVPGYSTCAFLIRRVEFLESVKVKDDFDGVGQK